MQVSFHKFTAKCGPHLLEEISPRCLQHDLMCMNEIRSISIKSQRPTSQNVMEKLGTTKHSCLDVTIFRCNTWLLHMQDNSFIFVTTYSYDTACSHVTHDSFVCKMTHSYVSRLSDVTKVHGTSCSNWSMTDSTENATFPKYQIKNSDSSVQIQLNPKSRFEFVSRYTEESEFRESVDFGDVWGGYD